MKTYIISLLKQPTPLTSKRKSLFQRLLLYRILCEGLFHKNTVSFLFFKIISYQLFLQYFFFNCARSKAKKLSKLKSFLIKTYCHNRVFHYKMLSFPLCVFLCFIRSFVGAIYTKYSPKERSEDLTLARNYHVVSHGEIETKVSLE